MADNGLNKNHTFKEVVCISQALKPPNPKKSNLNA